MAALRTLVVVCLAVLAVAPPPAAADGNCLFTLKDHSYDLTSLAKTTGEDYTGKDDQGYTYSMNVCAASLNEECTNRQGAICQYTNYPDAVQAMIGSWSTDPAPEWTLKDDNDPNKGVVLTYVNGDSCFPNTRQSIIWFKCAKKTGKTFSVTESSAPDPPCTYSVTLETPLSCTSAPPDDDGGSTGLSGGSIFLIALLCGVFVYIVAGCAWKTKKNGTKGLDSFPNIELWRDLPHLVKDGCVYSFNKTKACIGFCADKARGGGSGGAEAVPDAAPTTGAT